VSGRLDAEDLGADVRGMVDQGRIVGAGDAGGGQKGLVEGVDLGRLARGRARWTRPSRSRPSRMDWK
jgi:hypothetical protein